MSKTLQQELDEYLKELADIRKKYAADGTITPDEKSDLDKREKRIQEVRAKIARNGAKQNGQPIVAGGVSAKTTPAPQYKKTGLAEFMPAFGNPTAGLRMYNFADGVETPDGNQQNALKSQFFISLKESHKNYEIIGHTSGIGLDSAGGVGLSNKRARAVRDFLVKNGIKKEKFVRTYGKGSSSPLGKDMKDGKPSAEGAAWNRRVDIMPTENDMVVPDEVIDRGGSGDGATGGSGGGGGKPGIPNLPDGASDGTEKWLTVADISITVIEAVIGGIFVGGAAAILGPALNMLQVADAWRQAQKEANRRGYAFGFKLGTSAAVEVIRTGKDRVTAEQLWTMSKSRAKQFGNRRIPLEWWEIEQQISVGVEKSADIVNKAMEQAESELKKALDTKFGTKNGKLLYDANVKMVRARAAKMLADDVGKQADRVLS